MATVVEPSRAASERFEEKDFYLDEFRARTLCFAVQLADCEPLGGFETLGRVAHELMTNDTRVVILLGIDRGGSTNARWEHARRRLQPVILPDQTSSIFPVARGRRTLSRSFVDLTTAVQGDDAALKLDTIWQVLRSWPLVVALTYADGLLDVAERLATRLRVHKLVIIEPKGGVSMPQGSQLSFMDDAMLSAVLQDGEAEWAGLEGRRSTLRAVQNALSGGVHAVNLCTLNGLPRELYTYEGAGTLFTSVDYCRIDRLGIDDFEQVERLVERGQREGYLKVRNPDEITRILLTGYGATIGTRHLAGVCALEVEPYAAERAGEIVGLYTITRFKGEGVGVRLVERVLREAQEARLDYVFACTVDPRAQTFFERQGFRSATPDDVPAVKWVGYDAARRAHVQVLRRDLGATD